MEKGVFCEYITNDNCERFAENIHVCIFFVDLIIKNWVVFLNGKVIDMIKSGDFSFLD